MYAIASFRAVLLASLVSSIYAQLLSADLVGQLRNAPTAPQRIALLKDSDLVFDFTKPSTGIVTGAGGHTVEASSANFPAVVGNGVSMTIGFLGPCSINTPHTHPRATEINFSVNGTLRTGLLTENGARFVVNDLPPGAATVFPMGAIHFEMNTGCEPATFVAAFNDEDPGVTSLAQRYFGLPPDIVGATLGGLGVQEVVGLEAKIPDNVAAGTDECLKRCGLTLPSQPTKQHQPIVSGNAPPGVSVPYTTTAAASKTDLAAVVETTSTSGAGIQSRSAAASPFSVQNAAQGSSNSSGSGNVDGPSPVLIALLVINCLFAVGLLLAAFMFIKDRSRRSAFGSHKYANPSNAEAMLKVEKYEPERDSTYYDPYHPLETRAEPGVAK